MNERGAFDPSSGARSTHRAPRRHIDHGGGPAGSRSRAITDRELQVIIQRTVATQSIPDAACLLVPESFAERPFRCELDSGILHRVP